MLDFIIGLYIVNYERTNNTMKNYVVVLQESVQFVHYICTEICTWHGFVKYIYHSPVHWNTSTRVII